MSYYLAEVQNNSGYNSRRAELLKAENLTAAKREASKKAAFYNTDLCIGTKLTSDFRLQNLISIKDSDSKKWVDFF